MENNINDVISEIFELLKGMDDKLEIMLRGGSADE